VPLLEGWQRVHRAGLAVADPYVESFRSRIRDELLAVELSSSLAEAQVLVGDWRQDYNQHRAPFSARMMAPSASGTGYRTAHQAASEHLSPLRRAEQWLAGTTTINNHQLSQQVDR
jgi:Integrase core domain